jgi:crossover junction endodeoxyribonuclease RusA
VADLARTHSWPRFSAGALLRLDVEAWMPDRRRRDLDNTLKATQDAMTHAGIWDDDSQIDDLRIVRKRDAAGRLQLGGMLVIRLEAAGVAG